MSSDRLEGAIKIGVGHVQDAAGGLIGDNALQAKGKFIEATGFLQDAFGQAKGHAAEILNDVTDQAADALGQIEDQTRGALETTRGRYVALQKRAIDNPLAAVAIAAGVGLLVGLILLRRRAD
jgi:uncharacterized protein YjbJ (UPF0337 family)